MDLEIDQLSWKKFYENSKNLKEINKITDFNRLIAHSKNFFLVAGYGAFKSGYVLLITKDFIPSFGLLEKNKISELKYMISLLKNIIKNKFNKKFVVFEHGMCACVGGLDRAHLHAIGASEKTSQKTLEKAIDVSLYNRKAGIKYIKFKNYKLENIHDINQIFESTKNKQEIKIIGKILKTKNLKDLSVLKWPLNTLNHIKQGGHYVYFQSEYVDCSFLTKSNFQTQFGREIIYNNEIIVDKEFEKTVDRLKKKNLYLDVWRWQHYKFEENILLTIIKSKEALKELYLKEKYNYKLFDIEIV